MEDDRTVTKGILYTDGASGPLKIRRYIIAVVRGPDTGLKQTLDSGTVLIGTHENNDLVLKDPTVSRYHLEVQVRSRGLRISDLDSTNGTYMGETRLGSVVVRDRAMLKVGGETRIEIIPADQHISTPPLPTDFFGKAFGACPAMTKMFALLNKVAPTDSTILLQGETGTGKELIAEAIHSASQRSKKAFVVFDCGAVPRELISAELFGHTKGAFTGAAGSKRGLADEANKGTLFLDEIGELALDLQPQLLRLLEKKEVRPIGETRPHKVDVRVVAATNRDLRSQVKAGRFREDLFFRLAVVNVEVPPLRKRREDIPALAQLFLEDLGQGSFQIPEKIIKQLKTHDWPGNVRELRNVVERVISLTSVEMVPGANINQTQEQPGDENQPIPQEMMSLPFKEAKGRLVEDFEKEYLTQLLARHQGNISRAALEAGIDRNYIHRLVKKYGIQVQRR